MKFRKVKIFNGKKVLIRSLSKSDLKRVKEFQSFINAFVAEDAQIDMNKKITLKEEKDWMRKRMKGLKNYQAIHLIAEHDSTIIGSVTIDLLIWRKNHIGTFGITISKGYRRMGLGEYLSREAIRLAKRKLKPSPKIIAIDVLPTNKPARNLYKKLGFREVAKIPDNIQYKGKLFDEIIMYLYLSKKK